MTDYTAHIIEYGMELVPLISVKLCDLSACVGDEKGCNSSECKNPKWHRWPRKQFKEIFDREPHGYQFMEKQKVK